MLPPQTIARAYQVYHVGVAAHNLGAFAAAVQSAKDTAATHGVDHAKTGEALHDVSLRGSAKETREQRLERKNTLSAIKQRCTAQQPATVKEFLVAMATAREVSSNTSSCGTVRARHDLLGRCCHAYCGAMLCDDSHSRTARALLSLCGLPDTIRRATARVFSRCTTTRSPFSVRSLRKRASACRPRGRAMVASTSRP